MKKAILTISSCFTLILNVQFAMAQEHGGHHHGNTPHHDSTMHAHPHHHDSLKAGGGRPMGPRGEWKGDSTHHAQRDTAHVNRRGGQGNWDKKKGSPGMKERGRKE